MAIEAGDAVWYLSSDDAQLKAGLAAAEGAVRQSTDNVAQSMATVGKGMTALGVAITAPLAMGVSSATEFGSAMSAIGSLGTENMGQLETSIRETAVAFGLDLTEAAQGTYDAISSGADAFTAPKILEDAARAAIAGQTDLTTSIQMGMGVANAYGMEFSNMSSIFDAAFVGVNKGVMTFEELSASIGKATPAAAANKITMEELIGANAALTLGNVSASEGFTQLNAVMTGFTRQGESSKLETLGLQGALQWLMEQTGGNKTAMLEFLGSTEAMSAALALTGAQSGNFSAIMEEMANKTGAAGEAFNIIAETDPAFAWNQMKSAMQDLSITVGQALLPALKNILDAVTPIAVGIAEWAKEHDTLFAGIIMVTGAIGGLLMVIGPLLMLVPGIVALFTAMPVVLTAAGVAFAAVAGVITGPVIAAFAAVVLAGSAIVANWEEVKAGAETLVQVIAATPLVIGEVLYNMGAFIVEIFTNTWDAAVATVQAAIDAIVGIMGSAWDYISGFFGGIFDGINSVLEGLGLLPGGTEIPGITGNAEGGTVEAGVPTMVGERGPEMFIPQEAGRIMPTSQSGGGASININLGGVSVRNDNDMRTLSEMIASATRRELRAAGVTG